MCSKARLRTDPECCRPPSVVLEPKRDIVNVKRGNVVVRPLSWVGVFRRLWMRMRMRISISMMIVMLMLMLMLTRVMLRCVICIFHGNEVFAFYSNIVES